MAVARLMCNVDSSEVFHIIDTIICRGHELHFQTNNPNRANLAAINNKMDMALLKCDADGFEVFHIIDTIIKG